ncbi:hypothetical protein CTAM01_02937, partial [Colletotrichum tamarilloi]
IYFCILPLLAARAILSIVYTVLIHSISEYSYCPDRLFFFGFSTFPTFPPAKFKIINGDTRRTLRVCKFFYILNNNKGAIL